MITIQPARWPEDLSTVRALLREYADSIGGDICFKGFEAELAALPGDYAPPQGRLHLAWDVAEAVGRVALQPSDPGTCEIKRLFVRPAARAHGVGRRLIGSTITAAREAGYRRACLHTLPSMVAARWLYASLGFIADENKIAGRIEGAIYLGMTL